MKKISFGFATLLAFPLMASTTTYKIDSAQSKVGWTAKKLGGQHNGTLVLKDGKLEMDGDTLKGGEFNVDMQSIKVLDVTDAESNKDLTEHLKSDDFFSAAKHGISTFTIKKAEKQPNGSYQVTGPLQIKGISHDITVPLNIEKKEKVVTAKGRAVVDRTKWDIKYRSGKFFPQIGDKLIYDTFDIEVDLKAKK